MASHRQPFRLVAILAVILALLAASAPTSAGPRDGADVWGAIRGQTSVAPLAGSPGSFRVESRGSGWMRGVGRVQVAWVVPEVELDLLRRTITVADLEWSGTITAANGDQLFGRYEFPSDTIRFSRFGTVRFSAVLNVTGGTGQFANVTGQARSYGIANIYTRRFRIAFGGTLAPSD